ncbi:MAG: hypothetical protein J6B34_04240 [Clostridia bacterium]|nr:hypothetical protein [Clostridia bacterium]
MKKIFTLLFSVLFFVSIFTLASFAQECTEHNYDSAEITIAPSCTEDGLMTYTCSVCGATKTEVIPKTHHYHTVITVTPTCDNMGEAVHTCEHCGDSYTETLPKQHNYKNGIDRIVYSDFTSTGTKYYVCASCGSEEGILANPLFKFAGYSATEYDESANPLVSILSGYVFDADAIAEYIDTMGQDKLRFGVVGASVSALDGNAPLISETNEIDSRYAGYVKKIDFDNSIIYGSADGQLINIDYNNHATYFYLCLFVYDGEKTVYISDDSCQPMPLPVSYALITNSGADHDNAPPSNVDIAGMGYSTINGTTADETRITLIADSVANAATVGSSHTSEEDEDTIASIGNLGSFVGTVPNANDLLKYYLELQGDASHYRDLDVETLISKSTTAKNSWTASINNILRASELLAIEGQSVNIDQLTETSVQLPTSNSLWNSNRDWYLTFIDGAYNTDTDVDNLTVTVAEDGTKTFSATIVYTVIDYYSFYPYKDSTSTGSFLLWGPSRKELAQLHLDGNALDFLIESSITYTVSWTEGQRIAQDDLFNTIEGIATETNVGTSILTKVEQ